MAAVFQISSLVFRFAGFFYIYIKVSNSVLILALTFMFWLICRAIDFIWNNNRHVDW